MGPGENELFRRILWMVGPPSDRKDRVVFIFKEALKKFSIPLILMFWCYTWHAYAVGAVRFNDLTGEISKTVLKQDLSQAKSLSKTQNKTQFKRRPFIDKLDLIHFESIGTNREKSPARNLIFPKTFLFSSAAYHPHSLRAPPILK